MQDQAALHSNGQERAQRPGLDFAERRDLRKQPIPLVPRAQQVREYRYSGLLARETRRPDHSLEPRNPRGVHRRGTAQLPARPVAGIGLESRGFRQLIADRPLPGGLCTTCGTAMTLLFTADNGEWDGIIVNAGHGTNHTLGRPAQALAMAAGKAGRKAEQCHHVPEEEPDRAGMSWPDPASDHGDSQTDGRPPDRCPLADS